MYINKHCYHYTARQFIVINILKLLVNVLLQVFIILHILHIISITITLPSFIFYTATYIHRNLPTPQPTTTASTYNIIHTLKL